MSVTLKELEEYIEICKQDVIKAHAKEECAWKAYFYEFAYDCNAPYIDWVGIADDRLRAAEKQYEELKSRTR